jgi:DNA sulfur modification protein DndD
VILDTIILNNFGIYGGRQDITLTPDHESRPIILFGGLNGGGKTTFLDAVQLALYGSKARCSNRGKLAYRDYLRAAIHRNANPAEGASITIHFRRSVEGRTHSYQLVRFWHGTGRDLEESVKVFCDGELDSLLSEHWEEYIESYIPSGISHLFFFDAEQIKELAEGERSAELLGTAIHSLLGLDLVDRLEGDLIALERRKKVAAKTGNAAHKLKEAEEHLQRIEQIAQETSDEAARIRGQADQIGKALGTCEQRFRLEGGDLFERRVELEGQLEALTTKLGAEECTLREMAAGAAPFLLVASLIEQLEMQARREIEVRKAQMLVAALEDRDAAMLHKLRDNGIPRVHISKFEKLMLEDRKRRAEPILDQCVLNAEEDLLSELRHLRAQVLPEVSSKLLSGLETAANIRERMTRTEVTLARVPAADAIAGLQRELEATRISYRQKKAEVEALETKLQIIERQRAAAEATMKRALEEDAEKQFNDEDRQRVLKHSSKVRNTLCQFRTIMVRKHAARIEQLMLEAFTQLLRKRNLVTGLKIDPETFRIELTGGDGRPLPFDRLSAGERQLLATSLLWGLARASGRPLPTIIDTPLGRLDSSHRQHLVERYFPVASHQVILLSTDEEIDESNLNRLRPYIGRSYYLAFDEPSHSTSIMPGYFWNHEAAG